MVVETLVLGNRPGYRHRSQDGKPTLNIEIDSRGWFGRCRCEFAQVMDGLLRDDAYGKFHALGPYRTVASASAFALVPSRDLQHNRPTRFGGLIARNKNQHPIISCCLSLNASYRNLRLMSAVRKVCDSPTPLGSRPSSPDPRPYVIQGIQ